MPLTLFLAKLLGLYCGFLALALFGRRREAVGIINVMLDDPAAIMLAGVIAFGIGLAMVLGHNVWAGGWLPVLVTLTGWLVLIKGAALLALPSPWLKRGYLALNYERFFPFYMGFALLLGVALSWGGFCS